MIDTKIRKLITWNRKHHPRADIERLCVKRENDGRVLGMINKTTTVGLKKYWHTTTVYSLQLLKHKQEAKEKIIS